MKKDYKTVLKNKRLEAGKLMTEDQIIKCNAAIHTATVAAGASGIIPIPVADAIPMSAAQVLMIIGLGKIFDQKVSESAAKGLLGAAASTFVGRELFKFIPVVGWITSAGIAAGVTEAVGWTVAVDFAKSYRQEYERKKNAEDAANAYAEAEYYKESAKSTNEVAEDFSDDENIE